MAARTRELLVSKIFVLRAVQVMGGVKDSELFKMIAQVFRDSGGESTNVFLIYLIRQIEAEERKNR
ncbi:MAG: hypothetical protein ICV63_04245 [Coleofasciculus sp. Co-bin14]|nr:hypothetical protein [Coleofasciculus sp. Co-bin14]